MQTPAPPLKASDTVVALARVLKLRALCRVRCPTRPWWALCDLIQTTNEKLKTRSDRKGWVLPESESRPCGRAFRWALTKIHAARQSEPLL